MERLLTLYSEVQSTDVRWLWYPFIAIGKITLLQGDPGDGKSTMMMNLIAELSTGGKTPDGCKIGAPQKVIYQCSEDGVSDTIKPRLERCGADCRKIAFINEEVYNGLTLDDERMACIRLFEGIKYVLPILHPNKKRLALIMCPEEDSASVEWARQKGENWVNKDITSLEFVENIFRLMNWNRECRYKVLGRVANSDQGLCMLFDLEEAIMFTPKPQEYADPLTGEMKKKQMKFFPDTYRNRIGKSYNDYIADHQMNMFEDFIGYQSSTVLDEPDREVGTTSIPIPQREESENIPSPDLPEQLENVQQSGNEIAERGMQT